MNPNITPINYAIDNLAKIIKILNSGLRTYRYYQLLHAIFFRNSYFSDSWKNDIDKVLEQLSIREKAIIRGRFGLDSGEPKTLEKIASEFGVTKERIRQIEHKALRRLKHPSRRLALLGIEEKAEQKTSPVIITKIISGGITLDDLDLPTRICNALRNAGYATIEQLANTPKADFLKIRNIGLKSIEYLRDSLRTKVGVDLDDEAHLS